MTDPFSSAASKLVVLQNIKGAKAKASFLAEHAEDMKFRSLLYYSLNPLLAYNLSEKKLQTAMDRCNTSSNEITFETIATICSSLAERKGVNRETEDEVARFLLSVPEQSRNVYIQILSKTLKLGVTAKSVNKIIQDLIPEWEVQQAYPIEKYPIQPGEWFSISQKLNGVRATYYRGKLIARSGVPFTGMDHIVSTFEKWDASNSLVFDGELTLANPDGISDNEAFRKATGIANSDSEHKTELCFTVFDVVQLSEFESMDDTRYHFPYRWRRNCLNSYEGLFEENGPVRLLPVLYQGTDQSKIPDLLSQMVAQDKEGLMVNLDVPYLRKRHNGILKVKRFYTMDLPIIRCEAGTGRLRNTLGSFVLNFNGSEVSVGSGFTDRERVDFWRRKEELPGMICEVKYKEVSTDKKTGQESLQFPVFVSLRPDKAEGNIE